MARRSKKISLGEALALLQTGKNWSEVSQLIAARNYEELRKVWSNTILQTLKEELKKAKKPEEKGEYTDSVEVFKEICEKNKFNLDDASFVWNKHLSEIEKNRIKILYYYGPGTWDWDYRVRMVEVQDISKLGESYNGKGWRYGSNISNAFETVEEVIEHHKKFITERIESYQKDLETLLKAKESITITTEKIDENTYLTTSYFPISNPEELGEVIFVSEDRRKVCHRK